MLVENQFGHGGLKHKEDKRDYKYIGKATVPYDWTKPFDVETLVGKIPSKNQNGSFSCGGQAWAYYMGVLDALNDSRPYNEKSAKFIYAQTFVGSGGSDGRANSELCVKQGNCLESLCVSYNNGLPPDEAFITRLSDVTESARNDAKLNKALYYGNVNSKDIDAVANAVQSNNGCVLGVYGGNNGTWLSPYPKVGKWEWTHWVMAGKVKMENGIKYIGIKNSWGDSTGDSGWQWLSEDFFTKGKIFVAWTMTYDKTDFVVPENIEGLIKNNPTWKDTILYYWRLFHK